MLDGHATGVQKGENMKNLKKIDTNYYLPDCFLISLSDTSLNESNFMSSSDFFHEYIHYLQTISLPFMQIKFVHFSETLATMANQAYTSCIECRPFKTSINDIQIINEKLFHHYFDLDEKSYTNFSTFIDITKDTLAISDSITVNEYYLTFENDESENIKYKITASDLVENMAANIEASIFGKQKIPDFPYRCINIIVNHRYKKLKLSEYQISKLIELSLYSLDPVDFLFNRLDYMLSLDIQINDNEYENIFFQKISFHGVTPEMTFNSLSDWMNYTKCNICKNINNILGVIAFRYDTNHFENIIDYAYSKRKNNLTLISDISNKPRNELLRLYSEYTLPLVHLENDHIVSSKNDDGQLTLIPAVLDTVYENLCGSINKQCQLYGTCSCLEDEVNGLKYTDGKCITNPFEKDLNHIDCPFSLYVRAKKIV
jgi:hypothetical protein